MYIQYMSTLHRHLPPNMSYSWRAFSSTRSVWKAAQAKKLALRNLLLLHNSYKQRPVETALSHPIYYVRQCNEWSKVNIIGLHHKDSDIIRCRCKSVHTYTFDLIAIRLYRHIICLKICPGPYR